jgi:predicted DNA-binding transcriptional regulator AlpA
MEKNENILMTVKQVGAYLNLSVSNIDRQLADGGFVQPDYLISKIGKRIWKKSTIDSWLESCCRNPKSIPAA